jgi:hypothetical protein
MCASSTLGLALRIVGERRGGLQAGDQRDGDDAQRDQHLDQREAAAARSGRSWRARRRP